MDPVTQAPDWFTGALAVAAENGQVTVADAKVCYRVWDLRDSAAPRTQDTADSSTSAGTATAATGILLVHGGAAHSHWWDHIAPQLATEYRVAALDLTGHGDSDTREHYALELWAEELLAVVEAAELGPRPVIVGHSMGGMVTFTAAHLHGDRLGGIQVIDSPLWARNTTDEGDGRSDIGGAKKVYADRETALSHFRLVPSQPVVLPYVARHVSETSLGAVPGGWSWKFDPSLIGRDASDLLGEGKPVCPFAYFRAEDGIINDKDFAEMRARFGPRTAITRLPHSGHHPMADQPLMLIAAIRATLSAWESAT